jgi:hypothetical protein
MMVKPIRSMTSDVNITHAAGLSRDFTVSFFVVYKTRDLLLSALERNQTKLPFSQCVKVCRFNN